MKKFVKTLFSRDKFLRVTLPIILVLALVIIGFFSFQKPEKNLSPDEAKTQAESFINSYLMQGGNKATIQDVTSEYGLYKFKIDIVSDVVESYLSKDGKLFFPQALNVEEVSGQNNNGAEANNQAAPAATVSQKSDKPVIELFVMSHCPFGTQMEKGILPVVEKLGNKVNFQIKFNSYAMHGETELREQLAQYCIQKEQSDKYRAYLTCFLESGESAPCLTKAGVKKSSLDSCVAKTDKEFKVIANFNDKVGYQGTYPGFDIFKSDNEKYGVGGSPTLVINGQEISSGRDSASLLKTICSAFNNEPSECQASLSSASPAPGFGTGTASGSTTAGCE